MVIAGLDPAIQENLINAANFAVRLDCRVKPGNESIGGGIERALRVPSERDAREAASVQHHSPAPMP
jgi:hypothetical protein